MRRIILLIFCIILNATALLGCEICGGGLGSNNTGLLPNFNKRFVGIRYHFNQLYTQLDINGQKTALSNIEKYQTTEVWGAWNIGTRWRVMAILPYSQIEKYNYGTSTSSTKSGLGDINLSGYYNLINNSNLITQSLWIGVGVKLATGSYNKNEFVNSNSSNIYQLGTGSTDFNGSINHDISYNNFGLNTNVNYKVNTENKVEYRYGDKITINSSLYYNAGLSEQFKIRPYAGVQVESQQKDHTLGYRIEESGGSNTNLNIGLESRIRSIAFGASYQQPLTQQINQGRTELKHKLLTHVTFTF